MTTDQLFRIALMVVLAGVILLAVTYLFSFLLPILTPIVLLVLAYFIYKYLKTGTFPF